jgi:hypothetical protein
MELPLVSDASQTVYWSWPLDSWLESRDLCFSPHYWFPEEFLFESLILPLLVRVAHSVKLAFVRQRRNVEYFGRQRRRHEKAQRLKDVHVPTGFGFLLADSVAITGWRYCVGGSISSQSDET